MFSRLKHDTCKKVQSTGRSISEHFPDWKCLSFNILWGIFNFSYDIKIDKRYNDGRLKQSNLVYLEMTISNEILQWPHQEDDNDDSHNHQLQLSNISVMVQWPLSHHSEAIISISPKSWSHHHHPDPHHHPHPPPHPNHLRFAASSHFWQLRASGQASTPILLKVHLGLVTFFIFIVRDKK